MDESLFQKPVDDDVEAHHHSIAESLQVVRYRAGEEYTAHHDFVYPSQQLWYQPTRFATLLLYLNDDFEGGHTVFPRAVTRDLHDGVRAQPKKGTAVLFYSLLPDGNVDDRSQHASEPVLSGEKVRRLDHWYSIFCISSSMSSHINVAPFFSSLPTFGFGSL